MPHIPGLDALRVVAIALVVLYHLGAPVSGGLGVTVFFVLSGFLITRILLREIDGTGTVSLRAFYRRRALRIFPAFYVAWVFTAVMLSAQHAHIAWGQALASAFYVSDYARAFTPIAKQPNFFMGVSWSLAIEEQFYLVWPLLLLWMMRRAHPLRAMLFLIGGLWAWRLVLMYVARVSDGYIYNAFDTRADALFIGCVTAMAVRSAHPMIRWITAAPRWTFGLTAAAFVGLCVSPGPLLAYMLAPVLIAAMMLQWTTGIPGLDTGAVRFFARLSYSLYLFHTQLLGVGAFAPKHLQRAATVAVMLLAAVLSYYLIERPFLSMRTRRAYNSRHGQQEATAKH